MCNTFRDMNFGPMIFGPVNYGQVTDRQTDRQKVMHMSPPCIRTGGLKNCVSCNFMKISRVGRLNKNFFLTKNFMAFCIMLCSIIYREKGLISLDHGTSSSDSGFTILHVLKCLHFTDLHFRNKPNTWIISLKTF